MIEITISKKCKIPTEQWANEEFMVAVKREYADSQCVRVAFEELNKEVQQFADLEKEKIKAKCLEAKK
jgi:DNA-directed RNA polymerase delta subunit